VCVSKLKESDREVHGGAVGYTELEDQPSHAGRYRGESKGEGKGGREREGEEWARRKSRVIVERERDGGRDGRAAEREEIGREWERPYSLPPQ
jgi:hypothetical protein